MIVTRATVIALLVNPANSNAETLCMANSQISTKTERPQYLGRPQRPAPRRDHRQLPLIASLRDIASITPSHHVTVTLPAKLAGALAQDVSSVRLYPALRPLVGPGRRRGEP